MAEELARARTRGLAASRRGADVSGCRVALAAGELESAHHRGFLGGGALQAEVQAGPPEA